MLSIVLSWQASVKRRLWWDILLTLNDRSTFRRPTTRRATLKQRAATFSTSSVERPATTLTFPMWSMCLTTLNEPRPLPLTTSLCDWTWLGCVVSVLCRVCLSVCVCVTAASVDVWSSPMHLLTLIKSTACCSCLFLKSWRLSWRTCLICSTWLDRGGQVFERCM